MNHVIVFSYRFTNKATGENVDMFAPNWDIAIEEFRDFVQYTSTWTYRRYGRIQYICV